MNGKNDIVCSRVLAGVLGFLACGAPVEALDDVTIANTVNFSALDGGPLDDDGVKNGVFLVDGDLTLRGLGTIILDEPFANFSVFGDLRMRNSGAIRTPSVPTMDPGPGVFITCQDLIMTDNALIRSHGLTTGGFIQPSVNSLDMRKNARIEAHSTVADGLGGNILLFSNTFIHMMNTTNRITANGMNGGSVQLFAFSSACNAMVINSTINAVGFNGLGGFLLLLTSGGATFQDGQLRVAAIGTTSPGEVFINVNAFVSPDPPQTNPPAQVTVSGNICTVDP